MCRPDDKPGSENRASVRLSEAEPPVKDMVKRLREVANGFEIGQAFYTALELNIFGLLRKEMTAAAVAAKTGTVPALTAALLDLLAGLELIDKHGDRYVLREELVPFLCEDEPYFAGYLKYSLDRRRAWASLGDILRSGAAPDHQASGYEHELDRGSVEHMARNAMLGRLQVTVKFVARLPEFRSARRLIDLGGGHGLFGIALAQENPDLEVVIFDRPGVAEVAQDYIALYGLQARVRTVAGDYNRDDLGSGYDLALDICSFGGSHPEAEKFYAKASGCLNEGGLFIKSAFTLDNDRTGPLLTLMFDLEEQITGHCHPHQTNRELFSLFRKAGLQGEDVIDLSPFVDVPMRLLIARKVC